MSKSVQVSSLLPPNTTQLERIAVQALGELNEIPIPIRTLANVEQCPLTLLPYLAWAHSVDRWDAEWSEKTKRAVTRDAFFVHQRKGTIGALRRVVAPFGFLLHVKEWWQFDSSKQPGTFHLEIGVLDSGITEAAYHELVRLIEDAKPLSRHLISLALVVEIRSEIPITLACHDGHTITIYPPSSDIEMALSIAMPGYSHTIDTLRISEYI